MRDSNNKVGKPFVKWAGGKTQLIFEIDKKIPNEFNNLKFTYIEPFVGGGAVLFYLLNNYPSLDKAVINDINSDLITTYKTIKNSVDELILTLTKWQTEYYELLTKDELKKEYYYQKRELFNGRKQDDIRQAALFIFLNRTCFNGLYRVNRKNEFNVPIGSYKKPLICNAENLLRINKLLQKVEILNTDFEKTIDFAEQNTLFYFDPPYKPLNETSNFNSYAKDEFDDNEQIRLAKFCQKISVLGHKWILSNSDVKGNNPDDDFFDSLFARFNIDRVLAKRSINANPEKRGVLTELLITN